MTLATVIINQLWLELELNAIKNLSSSELNAIA
jgi:hypothetical protein